MYTPDKFSMKVNSGVPAFICPICNHITSISDGSVYVGCPHFDMPLSENEVIFSAKGIAT